MVLLVVDTQKLITTLNLYNFNAFENAVKTLIAAAREHNVEVIYVRHDDGADAELSKGRGLEAKRHCLAVGYKVCDCFWEYSCCRIVF